MVAVVGSSNLKTNAGHFDLVDAMLFYMVPNFTNVPVVACDDY